MMLNASSTLSVPPETHYFDWFWKKARRIHIKNNSKRFSRLAKAYLNTRYIQIFKFSETEKDKLLQVIGDSIDHAQFLNAILKEYANKYYKYEWIEKTPGHGRYIDAVFDVFPSARIINIIRDPRDVFCSHKHVPWGDKSPVSLAKKWNYFALLEQKLSVGSCITIRYEDLLADPEKELRRASAFLNIPYEQNMLRYYLMNEKNFDEKYEPWKSKNITPLDKNNSGKWQYHLERHEIEAIERVAGSQMEAFNYLFDRSSWKKTGALCVEIKRTMSLFTILKKQLTRKIKFLFNIIRRSR